MLITIRTPALTISGSQTPPTTGTTASSSAESRKAAPAASCTPNHLTWQSFYLHQLHKSNRQLQPRLKGGLSTWPAHPSGGPLPLRSSGIEWERPSCWTQPSFAAKIETSRRDRSLTWIRPRLTMEPRSDAPFGIGHSSSKILWKRKRRFMSTVSSYNFLIFFVFYNLKSLLIMLGNFLVVAYFLLDICFTKNET